jgi:hypothetical protein
MPGFSSIVRGSVRVKRNASLVVGPPGVSTIRGNLRADHCASVLLSGSVSVGGNVHIQHCTADSGYVGPGIQIGGNFECHQNSGACTADKGAVSAGG